jgi:hypothetical protein
MNATYAPDYFIEQKPSERVNGNAGPFAVATVIGFSLVIQLSSMLVNMLECNIFESFKINPGVDWLTLFQGVNVWCICGSIAVMAAFYFLLRAKRSTEAVVFGMFCSVGAIVLPVLIPFCAVINALAAAGIS